MKKLIFHILFTLILAALATAALHRVYLSRPSLTATLEANVERPVTFTLRYDQGLRTGVRHMQLKPGQSATTSDLNISRLHHITLSYNPAASDTVQLRRVIINGGKTEYVVYDATDKQSGSFPPQTLKISKGTTAPQLRFNSPAELRSHRECDTALMLSIFMLFLLFFWKMLTRIPRPHLPQFCRPVGKRALLAAAFTCVFCTILVLPWCHINTDDTSITEGRKLANFPSVISGNKGFNLQFGHEFEAWFQDRFWLRTDLVKNYNRSVAALDGKILENGAAIMNQQNGWMFYKEYMDLQKPDEKQMADMANNLSYLKQFCDDHGIALYLMVCPGKESVYAEHNPKARFRTQDAVFCFIRYLQSHHVNIDLVYPYAELRSLASKQPQQLLHYKTDTHINEDGCYEVVKALTEVMHKRFPDLVLQPKSSFKSTPTAQCYNTEYIGKKGLREYGQKPGSIETMLQLQDRPPATHYYPHYSWEQGGLTLSRTDIPMAVRSHFEGGHHKALLIGDSTTQYVRLWLHTMFKDMLRIRANNKSPDGNTLRMSRWESLIENDTPEILIICVGEGTLFRHISTMY